MLTLVTMYTVCFLRSVYVSERKCSSVLLTVRHVLVRRECLSLSPQATLVYFVSGRWSGSEAWDMGDEMNNG